LKTAISEYIGNNEIKKRNSWTRRWYYYNSKKVSCNLDSPWLWISKQKHLRKMGGTDIGVLRKYSKPRHIPFVLFPLKDYQHQNIMKSRNWICI
jgi:hypothetical protein